MSERGQQLPGRFRWWFLPSWLGLDAPCVVCLWLFAIARSVDQIISTSAFVALFGSVWSIYLFDRLVDVARCRDWNSATGRLRFGKRFRLIFVVCLFLSLATTIGVAAFALPQEVLFRGLWVGLGVVAYFFVFVSPLRFPARAPGKEIAVGFFFGAGVWAAIGLHPEILIPILIFQILAAFNCLVISARDAETDLVNDLSGASHWWRTIDRDLLLIGAALTGSVSILVSILTIPQLPLIFAIGLSLTMLTVLHAAAKKLSADTVRATADFCLLTPFIYFFSSC